MKRPELTPEGDYLYKGRYYESYPYEEVVEDERLADLEADRRLHIQLESQDILGEMDYGD